MITQVEPIAVVFTIPEDNLPMVLEQVRKAGAWTVEAFDRDLNTRLATGSLLTVDNQIDPTTGTVKLKATFANADGGLFPNQFVNARLLVDTIHGARHRADGRDPAQPAVDLRLRRSAWTARWRCGRFRSG